MKPLPLIIIAVIIIVLAYLYLNKPTTTITKPVLNNNGYAAGLALANLISGTKCGKNGNPPCTPKDLADAGWTQDQIVAAEQGSTTVQNFYLCENFGVNC